MAGAAERIITDRPAPHVLSVALNRPSRRNAVSLEMWQELRDIFAGLADDREVRLVILTGTGGHFSAGADISEFSTVRANAEMGAHYDAEVDRCYEALATVPQPTIAAVSGYAVGGGCALSMACDFRVAHTSARFGIPAAKLGLVYTVRESQLLTALVGLSNAKKILFSGEQIDAAEAARMGLVDTISDGEPVAAAIEFAGSMVDNAPLSIAGAKLILDSIALGTVNENADAIQNIIDKAFNSADYEEGAKAFMEKRAPRFSGS